MSKEAPTPQAVTGWEKKCDNLVAMEKDLAAQQAELESKLDPIREEFEPDIEKTKKAVAKLKAEVVEFGTENAWHLFAESSQRKTKTSVITGKSGPESLAFQNDTDPGEILTILDNVRRLKKYVAVKKSLDKTALKKALQTAKDDVKEALQETGLLLARKFSLTVKPKGD